MSTDAHRPDPRTRAAEYRAAQQHSPRSDDAARDTPQTDTAASTPPPLRTAHDRAAYIETAIQQAIRRGEFDDLPGSGKPIDDLGTHHDPDWWIRRKIQTENLEGLGPPALRLRVEHAEMAERLDALTREADVREHVTDFNARVRRARMQLQGGPPVVTPEHDVDAEVAAWAERRAARAAAVAAAAEAEARAAAAARPRGWFGRRRRPRE